ncbi:MAG: carbonate dehydratase [Candidatus Omnitrophica bacterium]|nr:carbonate dehydratase [Candidatus Omnitrophota bacterium]
MLNWNPEGDYPEIDKTAYIDPTAVMMGKVKIGKNVFIGPGAVLRADEPKSSIIINDNCNVQDKVIIHALENTSVLIEENTSLTHGCIIHGPCKIGRNSFVGFGSVVFGATLGQGAIIKHLALVENADVPPYTVVESRQVVNDKDAARRLECADKEIRLFSKNVLKTNLELVKRYKGQGKK